ncbi:hypothetical protein HKK52_06155 [Pseudomonas sp. ADAK2]|uniref:hypothetical protein n=1 Tax=unclassified Pseudomonas TaxID=196821 RepID=UPI0014635741|nr:MULTISPECIES: hypothetical protein [unclassified Pseudomonas]QJI40516.1 hypothetical protein HKK53_06150 [Pseudomonas sp. ADAK7]QJI46821.1 hypothetical protein HKK52_06155 [Pseudomonas sp. ADAK2]
MATSYADSAQAREWDRRYDAWGREKRPQPEEFHDYEAEALKRTQALADRSVRELDERKASAKRVAAATDAIGEFWGLKEKSS